MKTLQISALNDDPAQTELVPVSCLCISTDRRHTPLPQVCKCSVVKEQGSTCRRQGREALGVLQPSPPADVHALL